MPLLALSWPYVVQTMPMSPSGSTLTAGMNCQPAPVVLCGGLTMSVEAVFKAPVLLAVPLGPNCWAKIEKFPLT